MNLKCNLICLFRDETEGAEWSCSTVLLRAYEVKVDIQVATLCHACYIINYNFIPLLVCYFLKQYVCMYQFFIVTQ